MGGKTATSQSSVNIPPQVLAQYQAVNDAAEQTAQTPFQQYGGEFVAPVNDTQMAGIAGTSAAANEAQPFYQAATGTLGSAQLGVNPLNTAAENGTAASASPLTGADIERYLSPYLSTVLGSTSQLLNQNNQQQQAGQLGDAIRSGAFGGDRTGIAAANLEQQQNLANANIYSGIANEGYKSALSTAQGQQQIGLAGAQQLAGIGATAYGEGANTASEIASLGAGAQTAGLSGAGAQIAAGTVEQQTQQAQDTALYNQFLQQQSYPFQIDQFLANIAEGTGSLSGSTTTTTQPQGILSDRRLKHQIRKIGRTFDGQDIVTYKMGDDERTHIGLIAQDVEKKHPQAVGLAGGFKTVDYGKATEKAANAGHFYAGGVVPFRRVHRDMGGALAGVLAAQQQMYGARPGLGRQIPTAGGGGYSLAVAQPGGAPPSETAQAVDLAKLGKIGYDAYNDYKKAHPANHPGATTNAQGATAAPTADSSAVQTFGYDDQTASDGGGSDADANDAHSDQSDGLGAVGAKRGGQIRRRGLFGGGQSGDALANTVPTPAANAPTETYDPGSAADPYGLGANAQQLNIPTSGRAHTLAATPAGNPVSANKQNLSDFVSVVGQFIARGGRVKKRASGGVAGRHGYDDGGNTTDDGSGIDQASGVTTPVGKDTTVTASGPPASGVAPPDQPPASSGSRQRGDKPSIWSKISNVLTQPGTLALLEGIGAAGTAPTVHPGIALAAGLEAAAGSYPQIRRGLASAEQTQAQTRGIDIANRLNRATTDTAIREMRGPDGVAGVQPASQPSAMPATSSTPAQSAAIPYGDATGTSPVTGTPAPAASPLLRASDSTGVDEPADARTTAAAIEQSVRKQYAVPPITPQEADYQQRMSALSAATKNPAWLEKAKLKQAQRVQAQTFENQQAAQHEAAALQAVMDDPNQTQGARDAARIRYNYVAQPEWTGAKIEDVAGSLRSSLTGAPTAGAQAQKLTPQQLSAVKAAAYTEAMDPVTLGSGLPGYRYQQTPGMNSPDDYVTAKVNSILGGSAPPGGAASVPTTTTPDRQRKPAPAPPAAPHTGDSYLDSALSGVTSDRRYQENPGPAARDQPSLKARTEQQTLNVTNKQELATEARQITAEQAAARQYLLAAQHILLSPKAPLTGFPGYVTTYVSRLVNGGQASSSQVLAKNLINAAQQQFRTNFKNGTQSEFQTQVGEMSPNKDMTTQAIMDLTNLGLHTSDYLTQSADRALLWAKTPGVDALAFNDWNQNNFKREVAANATQTAKSDATGGERIYKVNGRWVHANGRGVRANGQ